MTDFYAASPDIHSFQRNFQKRSFQQGTISQEIYESLDKMWSDTVEKNSRPLPENISLENDLRSSKKISDRCKSSLVYSQNLYAALCNNAFSKQDKTWSCSWRSAGAIVANLREEGDYIDWYCSGIHARTPDYVPESIITDDIRKDITGLGWFIIENYNEDLL